MTYHLRLLFVLAFHFSFFILHSQDKQALEKQALTYQKAWQTKAALNIYEKLLKQDSSSIKYTLAVSILYSKVYHDQYEGDDKGLPYYRIAEYLARKGLKMDSNEGDAHYALAFALGVENENASHKQQIANSKVMKKELDKALEMNPHNGGAYHLLGRWYERIAEFNVIERLAVAAIYGSSLPHATNEDAQKCFEKAIVYEPDYILHQYELAYVFHKMGKDADAKAWLNHALLEKYDGDDGEFVRGQCRQLLKEIK
jgi:tetratricopeptide (TPR) repeat protein